MDCESITNVPAFPVSSAPPAAGSDENTSPPQSNYIRTPVASDLLKEIFLNRFHKEICQRYNFSLSTQLRIVDPECSLHDLQERRKVLQSRIRAGIQATTVALEEARQRVVPGHGPVVSQRPSLVVMASVDRRQPPISFAHIPVLCHELRIPLMLLPGNAAVELGRHLGVEKGGVCVLSFLPPNNVGDSPCHEDVHTNVDSFVRFILQKMEKEQQSHCSK